MTNKTRFFFIGLIFFFQALIYAQDNQQYLSTVGIIDSLYSEILEESRAIYVQLPASYQSGSQKKYPVVYILDGGSLLPTVSNVHDFYYGGFMPEMILIGISNRENRTRDLTTSTISERRGMPFTEKNGEAGNFINFIEKELIQFVENKYPVTNFRTLIGHSYGGLFTIYTLLNRPYLFHNYLAIDPSLDWDDQKLIKKARQILPSKNYGGRSLFMSLSGQLHLQNPEITIDNVLKDSSEFTLFARSNIIFSELVNDNQETGLVNIWKFYPTELHGTIPVPSIKDGLISLFDWFQMENTHKFNSPETPKTELFNIVKYRTKKLRDHFGYSVPPYEEDLFNVLGYMNLEMLQPEKAKMFFEFAIEYFPQSANAYDSMTDFYEAQNDKFNALKYASHAYELSGSDYHKNKLDRLKK